MKIFIECLRLNLKIMIQFWSVNLISIFLDLFLFLFNIAILKTIYTYNQSEIILGYTFPQMLWYASSTYFLWNIISSNPEDNLSQGIITGQLSMQLIKPLSVMKWEFAKAVSTKPVSILVAFLPSFLLFSLIIPPEFLTLASFFKFFTVAVLSFHLFFLINFIIGITAFDFKSTETLKGIKSLLIYYCGGAFFPLDFFPDFIEKIFYVLPFKYLFYVPSNFFINREQFQGTAVFVETVIILLVWILVFFVLAQLLWKKLLKRFYSVGG